MNDLGHLFPKNTGSAEQYTYARPVSSTEFRVPPRDDRAGHARTLISEIGVAMQSHDSLTLGRETEKPKGVVLDFQSDPEFKLQLKSLELRSSGVELRNSRILGGVMHATVFVPQGKVGIFVRKLEAYANKNTAKGAPKNKDLVESISSVRLAAIESFWTDSGAFPTNTIAPMWWEIWLREQSNPHDVTEIFRSAAQAVGIVVGTRILRFPERKVLLALASVAQLLAIENLFDILAEIRHAKILPSEFLALAPMDQAEFIAKTLERIQGPPSNAPIVCPLDTGANAGHPMLAIALSEQDQFACHPDWSVSDLDGHGTAMAGLALYGCLRDVLTSDDPWPLRHKLQTVKILPEGSQNPPDLYGEITAQAVSLVEIAAPYEQRRAFCLAVTADSRDEGLPSSWSAALDQISSGAEEEARTARLFFVSAGNTPADGRHNYPDHNHVNGIEDPAQAWNCITVGAFTVRTTIGEEGYQDWRPVAGAGGLSPSSRTSIIWQDRSWPLKPDIVMEGGNSAINPNTGTADYVDDLQLLTTRVSPSGALLTTLGDTSAAAALAARYGAIIWSHYPHLWPETVRGLLIHSASWTDSMLNEFPHDQRHNRLRAFGYGVPNLSRALWSASNIATLIVEDSLQPYHRPADRVKTCDMKIHTLPWPKAVLEELGELQVRMRVTLSYFIEPSPGRRGWTRQHRYQSHGLRFDVKRPLDSDEDFRKRISKSAWAEDEESVEFGTDDREWELGERLRCKGSVHSDTWTGTAAQLSACGALAIFPVTGWWKERAFLERWNRLARYALIATIETDNTEIDLYTSIAAAIGVDAATTIPAV